MYLKITYAQDFDDLMMHLKSKYPDKLFDLDGIGEQTDMSKFSKKFFSSKTTADASIDANSNVDDTSVIAYGIELPKPFFKLNSYYILWKELRRLYGKQLANEVVEKQLTGEIYIHDFHGIAAGLPYCFNYTTYDIMVKGLPMVNKIKSSPPKHLYAFKSQLEQFTVIASNSTLGATGLADMLVVMSYYVNNILNTLGDAHFKFASTEDCWNYISESLISFIYTINQPMRANQCVTEDTEVLTPNGFKKYDELSVGDDIYTWNKGVANIQKVKRVNVSDYDGIMHEYRGRDVVQTVTPNHRVLFKKNNSIDYDIKPSAEIFDKKTPLNIPIAMNNNFKEYPISDEWLSLCTFILTDGNIKKQEGKKSRISFFKSPTRWGGDEFEKLAIHQGLNYSVSHSQSEWGGIVKKFNLDVESSKVLVELLNNTKSELPEWFFQLSQRQATLVIDLWCKLDGHTEVDNYNKQKAQCDNYTVANQLQHVCFLSGRGSNISERLIGKNKTPTIYLTPYHRTNKYANDKIEIKYKGKVWCPTTDDGVVVFRKEGKIFISGNSPFTNISIYDNYFLEKLCGDYTFPDGSSPSVEIVNKLQELYLSIMNDEMERTPITFPVTTACFSVDEEKNIKDKSFLSFISKQNKKFGFINIYCGDSSTLSSCCRLRSEQKSEYFNSFGAGSSKIGSLGVCTINFVRLASMSNNDKDVFFEKLAFLTSICAKVNNAKRHIVKKRIDNNNLPLYTLGYMELSKQYSTVGVNGLNECLEIMGYDILSGSGQEFALKIMDVVNTNNKKFENQYNAPHNCEQVPAENTSIKLATIDRLLGYQDKYTIYSNQFIPLTNNADLLDRIKIQGLFDSHFSGGAIAHMNVDTPIEDEQQISDLIETCAKKGIVYFAVNYVLSECENGHMCITNGDNCTVCNGEITNKYTRVVGFLTNVKNWHKTRRDLDFPNRKFYKGNEI